MTVRFSRTLFFILAAICFALDGFKVANRVVNWTPLGFAFVALGLVLL